MASTASIQADSNKAWFSQQSCAVTPCFHYQRLKAVVRNEAIAALKVNCNVQIGKKPLGQ